MRTKATFPHTTSGFSAGAPRFITNVKFEREGRIFYMTPRQLGWNFLLCGDRKETVRWVGPSTERLPVDNSQVPPQIAFPAIFPLSFSPWPFYPLASDSGFWYFSLLRPLSLCLASWPFGDWLGLNVCFPPSSQAPPPPSADRLCWQASSPQEFTAWSPQPYSVSLWREEDPTAPKLTHPPASFNTPHSMSVI